MQPKNAMPYKIVSLAGMVVVIWCVAISDDSSTDYGDISAC